LIEALRDQVRSSSPEPTAAARLARIDVLVDGYEQARRSLARRHLSLALALALSAAQRSGTELRPLGERALRALLAATMSYDPERGVELLGFLQGYIEAALGPAPSGNQYEV